MNLSPEVCIAAPLIVITAYTIFGMSGFGSALISIPLLAHFLPLRTVVPTMLLLDFSAAVMSGLRLRGDADVTELRTVAPGLVVGAVIGVVLLSRAPSDTLLIPLGVFVLAFGAYNFVRLERPITFARGWGYVVGLLGGMIAALFGVGGPVYATYFSGRLRDPARLRATMSIVFSLSTSLRIVLFLISGLLLRVELWLSAAVLLPLVFAGVRLGHRLHTAVPRSVLGRLVSALLVGSGLSLVVRGFGSH
ncbi:MAG: TSUP family transporter [Betaproteobacteria bacterium]|nr:TSUP family transporter [Betaproteobacteria bacterium]